MQLETDATGNGCQRKRMRMMTHIRFLCSKSPCRIKGTEERGCFIGHLTKITCSCISQLVSLSKPAGKNHQSPFVEELLIVSLTGTRLCGEMEAFFNALSRTNSATLKLISNSV